MNHRILFPIATFFALLTFMSCSMHDDDDGGNVNDNIVNVGDPLPTFAVVMDDGTLLTTASLYGKPSLIVFFSTTCADCQRELPNINRRYLEHGSDTTFVAISREQSYADVSAYWMSNALSIPFSAQPDRYVYSLFANQGIPRIYISDSNCIVRKVE